MQLTMASAGNVCMVPITVVSLAISDFIDRVFTLRTSARATKNEKRRLVMTELETGQVPFRDSSTCCERDRAVELTGLSIRLSKSNLPTGLAENRRDGNPVSEKVRTSGIPEEKYIKQDKFDRGCG